MRRVLHTSVHGGSERSGFVQAESLGDALEELQAQGHRNVRFWTHPWQGDVEETSAEEAYARIAGSTERRRRQKTWAALCLSPFAAAWWVFPVATGWSEVGCTLDSGRVCLDLMFVASPLTGIWLMHTMRSELSFGNHRQARWLLWGLLACFPPLVVICQIWSVPIRAGIVGVEGAMRRHAWMPYVGLGRRYNMLRREALNSLGLHPQRLEMLEADAAADPGGVAETELALELVLRRRDPEAAREVLRRAEGRAHTRLIDAVRGCTRLAIAIEERDAEGAADAVRVRQAMVNACQGTLGPWESLLLLLEARATALRGDHDAAAVLFRRALPILLLQKEYELADQGAREIRAPGSSQSKATAE